ncbi:MAG TPA: GspH/FimT family pseudopilin [Gammaproteobacteria bacterium]|nr:GspH/FimT family pseudopilin [Gammaproteobacteria bacterium]
MGDRRQLGYTLWELMVTLAVAGVLLGIGVPNFIEFQRNGTMSAAANDVVTGMLLARSEALKLQDTAPVVFCLSNNPLDAAPACDVSAVMDAPDRGFVVWVDTDGELDYDAGETLLMRTAAPGGTIRVSSNCPYVAYGANGFARKVDDACFPTLHNFLYCDDRGRRITSGTLSSARMVRVDLPGRPQVLTELADVSARIGNDAAIQVDATCP